VLRLIGPSLRGMDAGQQSAIDRLLLNLDGTADKSHLGANALLGVSLAVARAAASSMGLPLYRYLGGSGAVELPVPMVNILSGRTHGGSIDFQDFMVVPLRAQTYSDALHDILAVYRAVKEVLKQRGAYQPGVAEEAATRRDSNPTKRDLR
jgi:enolase